MSNVDAGAGDRLALAVLAQYRMATTAQMHQVIAPEVRIEQTRRRLAKLREEGLVDRITLAAQGRTRVWFATAYGAQIAFEWPELRDWRPSRMGAEGTAVRLRAGHGLTVTDTAVAFLQDARRRGDICQPLDWITEVHHPVGGGQAVIPDALLFYRRGGQDSSMLRAFVEVDRATMGPERLAAKIGAYARLHGYRPEPVGRRRTTGAERAEAEWRKRYALFPRLLFVLDGTGRAGVNNRIDALHAAAGALAASDFLHEVHVMATPMADLLQHGPSAPIWHPVQDPTRKISWMHPTPGAAACSSEAPQPEHPLPTPSSPDWQTLGHGNSRGVPLR